jgi:hypothetical protein
MNISKLTNIHRTVRVPIDSDEIVVTYNLSALNLSLSDWLAEHRGERDNMLGYLERVIVSWDILDNGEPIPATVEAMHQYKIPTPILRMIDEAIMVDSSAASLRDSYKQPPSTPGQKVSAS